MAPCAAHLLTRDEARRIAPELERQEPRGARKFPGFCWELDQAQGLALGLAQLNYSSQRPFTE